MKILNILKKGDIVLFVIVALINAAALYALKPTAQREERLTAEIHHNGELINRIDLSTIDGEQRFYIKSAGANVVLAEKDRICIERADCPDATCVKRGWLTKKADMAVCIPGGVSVRIVGENKEVDGISG